MGRPDLRIRIRKSFEEGAPTLPAIITVDPRSGVPIYLQLMEQVKRCVALGTLSPGEQLPTVKALSLQLTVNPNTVARAYRELERDQVIETSPGRGSFVRVNGSVATATHAVIDVARAAFLDSVREAKSLGISVDQAQGLFKEALDHWYYAQDKQEDV
jgi:GntR family transcriptional regulator